MSAKHQRGILASAAITRLAITEGEAYGLIIGTEASDFNSFTVTPKLNDGVNAGNEATGTLTIDTQPIAADTMTVGTRAYEFVANDQTPKGNLDQIQLGANLADTQLAIVAAINGTDIDSYAIEAHAQVTAAAFGANDSIISSKLNGTGGNAIVTTETFTAGTNVFDSGTLGTTQAGTDSYTTAAPLPIPGSADGSGNPQVFSAYGMIEFVAILPELILVPSGAVSSVAYYLTRLDGYRKAR